MERHELGNRVDVAVKEMHELPGFVWKVTCYPGGLRLDYSVSIEYELAKLYVERDPEGAHLRMVANYSSQEEMIADLEEFLGEPLQNWTNYTRSPLKPSVLEDPDPERSLAYLDNLVASGSVPLPRSGQYEIASMYFREKYGPKESDDDEEEA